MTTLDIYKKYKLNTKYHHIKFNVSSPRQLGPYSYLRHRLSTAFRFPTHEYIDKGYRNFVVVVITNIYSQSLNPNSVWILNNERF